VRRALTHAATPLPHPGTTNTMRHLLITLTTLLLSSTSLSQQSPPPPQSPGETVARLQSESTSLLPLLESDLFAHYTLCRKK